MQFDGSGSSLIIVMAAVLWFAYLVPTWLRRRQYLATERNAVRLQQTLRILAETAEIPAQVRAETSARSILAQQKLMKSQLQRSAAIANAQDAANARAAARAIRLATSQPFVEGLRRGRRETNSASLTRGVSSHRLRRSRLLTSLVLLVAVVAAGLGIGQTVASPAVLGSWLLLGGGVVVAFGAFVLLGQMAAVGRARSELARLAPVAQSTRMVQPRIPQVQAPAAWTPVPIPKPLYLSRSEVPAVAPVRSAVMVAETPVAEALDAAKVELLEAAAQADSALRATSRPPVIRPAVAVAPAAVSRFARMGMVDEPDSGLTDLNDVLRRRRSIAG